MEKRSKLSTTGEEWNRKEGGKKRRRRRRDGKKRTRSDQITAQARERRVSSCCSLSLSLSRNYFFRIISLSLFRSLISVSLSLSRFCSLFAPFWLFLLSVCSQCQKIGRTIEKLQRLRRKKSIVKSHLKLHLLQSWRSTVYLEEGE